MVATAAGMRNHLHPVAAAHYFSVVVTAISRLRLYELSARHPPEVNTLVFFFQAEGGIRDYKVNGVQTCALPIWHEPELLTRSSCRPRTARGNSSGSCLVSASANSSSSPRLFFKQKTAYEI